MKKIYFIILSMYTLVTSSFAQSQNARSNIWFSLMYKYEANFKNQISGEMGYRTFQFLNHRRNLFTRIIYDYTLLPDLKLGVGFAYFNNYQFSNDYYINEYRPFVQIGFTKIIGTSNLSIRLRDEWRAYECGVDNVNRFRTQIGFDYLLRKKSMKITYENLYTNPKVIENRYTVGVLFSNNKKTYYIFYSLNHQSNIKYLNKVVNQSVLGFQYTLAN